MTRMILDNAVVGILLIDGDRLIVQANRYMADLSGYTAKELVGQSTAMLHVSVEKYHALGKKISSVLNSGNIFESDLKMRHKDGTVFPVHMRGRLIDADNPSIGSICSLEDVSGRYAAEDRLRDYSKLLLTANVVLKASQEQLDLAMQSANVGLWDWHPLTNELFTNKVFITMLGYEKDAPFPNTLEKWSKIVHPDDLQGITDTLQPFLDGDDSQYESEHRLRTADGGWKWIHDVGRVTSRNRRGQATRFIGVHIDINQTKSLQLELTAEKRNAEAANEAKSGFLANMSHELRTPLNAILGYTQLFANDTSLDSKQQKRIKAMHQAGEHLLMLINDILDLSKIEASKMQLVTNRFHLAEFLQGVDDIIRGRADAKGITFRCEYEQPLPEIIVTDELRLRQVILNLLSNAIKFTAQGHCILRIQSQSLVGDRSLLTVTIEDSGAGIVPEMQQQVFEPFQQTGDPLQYAEGSGLGLAICRQLTQLMGGDLQLISPVNSQSQHGEGPGTRCTFTIEVPVFEKNIEEQEEQKVIGYTVAGDKKDRKKILIVDDKQSNRAVLRDTLEFLGFLIEEASDGSEVLVACKQSRPDAILMDLRMPKIDGFTATKELKKIIPFKDIPIIAITPPGKRNKALRQRCLQRGFDGYLNKPCSVSELLNILARLLHLDLCYADASDEASETEKNPVPPQEFLDRLIDLAQSGDISAVSNLVTDLATMESGRYSKFANRIKPLAEASQLMAIENLIMKYQES